MTAQEIKVWIIPVGQQSVTIDDLVNRLAEAQWPPVSGPEKEEFDQFFDEFSARAGINGELLEAAKKGLLTVFGSRTGGPLTLSKNEEFPPGALVKVADLPAYLATRLNGLRVALATAGVATPYSAHSVQPATQAAPAALTPSPPSESAAIEPAPAANGRADAPAGACTLTTPKIAEAFDGELGLSAGQWRERLGDMPEWLRPARAANGTAPNPSTWWPLEFARILLNRGAILESLNRKFLNAPTLKPWLQQWQEQRRERNSFGQ